jgi:SAM-dependent methyltransferase
MQRPPIQASIERGWREMAAIDEAYARGEIDDAGWYARVEAQLVAKYLQGDNPRAQSGYSGDEAAWEQARSLVAEAIPRSGSFLDVGCASGLLMESVRVWGAARGLDVEPFGLDIAPELAALARSRLPAWADRVFEGNALGWQPPRRFDFVRTGLDYVPGPRRRALVEHLLTAVVAPGGRLIIGAYSEERDETRAGPSQEATVAAWGFPVAGRIERPHPRDDRVVRRLFYLDQ